MKLILNAENILIKGLGGRGGKHCFHLHLKEFTFGANFTSVANLFHLRAA